MKMAVAATNQIAENGGEFVKQCCWFRVKVKGDDLTSTSREEIKTENSMTATTIWTLSFLKKAFISTDREFSIV